MRKVVVNTTPLIALSNVGQIELLRHAKYLELPVTGTLGVLIKAKQEGYVDELKPILYQMVQNDIYISQSLIEMCLKQVGEIS